MSKIHLKQDIRAVLQNTLLAKFGITSYGEVDGCHSATKLGTLEHIDYALPLFGYARQAKKPPPEIYSQLHEALSLHVPCKTEFVNGFLNIMISNTALKEALASHDKAEAHDTANEKKALLLLRTSAELEAMAATKLIQDCLHYVGLDSAFAYPYPEDQKPNGQYMVESDAAMRLVLARVAGVVQDADSKAMYWQQGSESHALCSAKGGWYGLAFIISAIKEETVAGKRVFIVGSSATNNLIRGVFQEIESLDTDVHAQQLIDAAQRSVGDLLDRSNQDVRSQDIESMTFKQRRAVLYVMDFDYEITEAARLGDLNRMVGEIMTLIEQHPLADVA